MVKPRLNPEKLPQGLKPLASRKYECMWCPDKFKYRSERIRHMKKCFRKPSQKILKEAVLNIGGGESLRNQLKASQT